MSLPTWQVCLRHRVTGQNRLPRIAVLGIGNALRSDDGAGELVARRLARSRLTHELDSFLVIDGGHAPENMTGELRRFGPEYVILIDAAEMGETPGAIRWIGIHEIDGISASTHTLPLSMLAKYLALELGCEVNLLCIQPQSVEIGDSVSDAVLKAVEETANGLLDCLLEIARPELNSSN